jgi:hypothetical protein
MPHSTMALSPPSKMSRTATASMPACGMTERRVDQLVRDLPLPGDENGHSPVSHSSAVLPTDRRRDDVDAALASKVVLRLHVHVADVREDHHIRLGFRRCCHNGHSLCLAQRASDVLRGNDELALPTLKDRAHPPCHVVARVAFHRLWPPLWLLLWLPCCRRRCGFRNRGLRSRSRGARRSRGAPGSRCVSPFRLLVCWCRRGRRCGPSLATLGPRCSRWVPAFCNGFCLGGALRERRDAHDKRYDLLLSCRGDVAGRLKSDSADVACRRDVVREVLRQRSKCIRVDALVREMELHERRFLREPDSAAVRCPQRGAREPDQRDVEPGVRRRRSRMRVHVATRQKRSATAVGGSR